MGTTANYELRYPEALGVAPDVPRDLMALAEDVDEALVAIMLGINGRLPLDLWVGQATVNIPTSGAVGAGAQQAVNFPAGRFPTAPFVLGSKAGLPSGSGLVSVAAYNATVNGCTVAAYNAATTPAALAIPVTVLALTLPPA